jgi:hypothetical protein
VFFRGRYYHGMIEAVEAVEVGTESPGNAG